MQIFLGYASQPGVNRATLHGAARSISQAGVHVVTSWEDLRTDGQIIIDKITQAIDAADLCIFDVTTTNPNVLFELGYAVARGRRIAIFLESASATAGTDYKKFGLLREVGYFGWSDQASIKAKVMSGELDSAEPLGPRLIASSGPFRPSSVLFMPALHRSEPDARFRAVAEKAAAQRIDVVVADPTESRLEALNWYAAKAYTSAATLLHFESVARTDHAMHNARLALVGGMAHGYGRPLLMLADETYDVPLDYLSLLKKYSTPAHAERIASAWLEQLDVRPAESLRRPRLELSVELKSLNFGEHVAENEIQALQSYFVATSEYEAVLRSHLSVFTGRKGTGKTANLYQAASELRARPKTLVVVVRPAAYDFEGLVEVIVKYSDYSRSYAIDGMWKLLLLTEIARTIFDDIHSRESHVPISDVERSFLDAVEVGPIDVRTDFGARIDAAVSSLGPLPTGGGSERDLLNEALHIEWIGRLRKLLTPLLSSYTRLAVLVDNLDKGWERSADLDALSAVLLGLLGAVGRVERDLKREPGSHRDLDVSLALFMRSDIFAYVKERAREPDKIVESAVEWRDGQTLMRVLEARYLASRREGTDPAEMWSRYFVPAVGGMPTRDYMTWRVLPRPRDLIFLGSAAVSTAVNRGHSVVEEGDIRAAERAYSQFAFEALLVENGITVQEFEAVLLEFVGVHPVLTKAEVLDLIGNARISAMKAEHVLTRLKAVSFLGIETSDSVFEFPEIGRQTEKAEILARKLASSDAETRHTVHPAYRPFLEIADPPGLR